ncbi:MAG TPA: hypothetical protein VFM27_16775 [Acidimicrobiales bacterium]|nr:hypothetical protein [Acidimicrobiales bacterium]
MNQLAEQLRRWADDVEPVTADEARRRSSRAGRRTTWPAGAGIAGACALAVATVVVTGAGDGPERSATGDAPAPITPGEVEVSAHAAGLAPLAVTVGPPQAGAPAEAPAGAPPAWLHTIVRFENTGSTAVHLRRGHHTGKVGEPVARLVVADSACFWVNTRGTPDPYCPLVESGSSAPAGGAVEVTMVAWRDLPGLAPGNYTFSWPLHVRGPDDAGTTGSVSLTFAVP